MSDSNSDSDSPAAVRGTASAPAVIQGQSLAELVAMQRGESSSDDDETPRRPPTAPAPRIALKDGAIPMVPATGAVQQKGAQRMDTVSDSDEDVSFHVESEEEDGRPQTAPARARQQGGVTADAAPATECTAKHQSPTTEKVAVGKKVEKEKEKEEENEEKKKEEEAVIDIDDIPLPPLPEKNASSVDVTPATSNAATPSPVLYRGGSGSKPRSPPGNKFEAVARGNLPDASKDDTNKQSSPAASQPTKRDDEVRKPSSSPGTAAAAAASQKDRPAVDSRQSDTREATAANATPGRLTPPPPGPKPDASSDGSPRPGKSPTRERLEKMRPGPIIQPGVSPSTSRPKARKSSPQPEKREKAADGEIKAAPVATTSYVMPPADVDDDWDAVNRRREDENVRNERAATQSAVEMAALANGDGTVAHGFMISFRDVFDGIQRKRELWEHHRGGLVREKDDPDASIFSKLISCCVVPTFGGPGTGAYEERDYILCLQSVPLDCEHHMLMRRMLLTVYYRLTSLAKSAKERMAEKNAPLVACTGPHWEQIGFQGMNPATDLRSTGLFGLMQMLSFIEIAPVSTVLKPMYTAAVNPQCEFPFALVSLNFSGITMEMMKWQKLHGEIKKSNGRVADTMNKFHAGLMARFFDLWSEKEVRRITDFAQIKKQVKTFATEHTNEVFGYMRKLTAKRNAAKKVVFKNDRGHHEELKFTEF